MKPDLTLKLESNSPAQTISYGKLFAKTLKGGDLVVLAGALGGGKTTFTKGVLKGLGYPGRVLSPTFTLIRQYQAKGLKVYHADFYRLNKAAVSDLGFEEFFYSENSLILIEWGDKIIGEFPSYLEIKFSYLAADRRKLLISSQGYSREKLSAIKRIFKNELIGS